MYFPINLQKNTLSTVLTCSPGSENSKSPANPLRQLEEENPYERLFELAPPFSREAIRPFARDLILDFSV
ncbi:hypothetical protein JTE90_015906 [Oedothorax gibbosus]|uniref:Uncharacterized protein n=1 Tax=Oedothorax gibbosus TaxID=931172 RepID=A0AAV6VW55_9ARAC|nr:hypothetical protein JTE90_015906 [Oedothorax gibbosus]